MGKRIDKLNRVWSKKVRQYEKNHAEENPLAKYESYLSEETVFSVTFDGCDRDGTFTTILENDVKIIMKPALLRTVPAFRSSWIKHAVGFEFDVSVESISEEENTVYVKPVNKSRPTKELIEDEIMKELAAGNMPIVWGQVTSVRSDLATVDILGQHIMGVVKAMNWSNSYIRDLTAHCTPGEVHKFQIHNAAKKIEGRQKAFYLDRKPVSLDPWKELPLDYLHKGAIILVKCIERPDEKSYWWGISNMAPNIEIQGDYTRSVEVVRGLIYKCRIKNLVVSDNPKERIFKCVPIGVSDQSMDVYRAYLAEKKKKKQIALDAIEDGVQRIGE